MHPENRPRGRRRSPLDTARIEQVHIPGRPRCRKDAFIVCAEQFAGIPILTGALVRDERHPGGDILHRSAQFGHPDNVRCQIIARFTPEHIALNFERPSKTLASSRANEHHDADLANILVERRTQRFSVARDRLIMRMATAGVSDATSAQQRASAGGQKRLTFHRILIGEIRK